MKNDIEVVVTVDPRSTMTKENLVPLAEVIEEVRIRRENKELELAQALTEIRVGLACLSDAGNTIYTDILQAADDLKKYRERSERLFEELERLKEYEGDQGVRI